MRKRREGKIESKIEYGVEGKIKGKAGSKIRNKKGMGVEMVFVFIVAAITFALIMIFGYKSITDFMGKGEQVEFYQFKSYLETSVKKIYTEYGSVRIESFNLPMKYEKICFVELDKPYPGEENCDFDAYGCDVWKDAGGSYEGADENVFLRPAGLEKIKVYRIDIERGEGFLCLPINKGRFKLRLEGMGDRTKVSPAPRD